MQEKKKGIGAWLKEKFQAIGAVIGNLAARFILGKKGFNEAYQINLKNSIAEDIQGKKEGYKEHADPSEPGKAQGVEYTPFQAEERTNENDIPVVKDENHNTCDVFVETAKDIPLPEDRYIKCGTIRGTGETMYIDKACLDPHAKDINLHAPQDQMGAFIGRKGKNIRNVEAEIKKLLPEVEHVKAKELQNEPLQDAIPGLFPEVDTLSPELARVHVENIENILDERKAGLMEEYQVLAANDVPKEELDEIKEQLNETIRSKNIIQNVKAGDREYEGWLTDSMEKAGVIPKGNGRLYQAAMDHSDELIKIMDKVSPELKEDENSRVEIGNLDIILSKAAENGETKAVIQEKGQDGEIILSDHDIKDNNYLTYLQNTYFKTDIIPSEEIDIEQHEKDEAIIAEQEKADDIFEGFLEEDVPDAPAEEPDGTFSVLDMNIEQAKERQNEGLEAPAADDLEIE